MTEAGSMTGKPLIESDRVEGTTVYDRAGNNIGSIKRLMIDKISGRVAYAVMTFGGFLGMGSEQHAVPWSKLAYDTVLGGYRTDITEHELRGAPAFSRQRDLDLNDRLREQELHNYYGEPSSQAQPAYGRWWPQDLGSLRRPWPQWAIRMVMHMTRSGFLGA
jgi:hypothetical protein